MVTFIIDKDNEYDNDRNNCKDNLNFQSDIKRQCGCYANQQMILEISGTVVCLNIQLKRLIAEMNSLEVDRIMPEIICHMATCYLV